MAHMITMPPGTLTPPSIMVKPPNIFVDSMSLGDTLDISFKTNGTFWGLPPGFFYAPDLPFPGISETANGLHFISGASKLRGTVVLVFYDSDHSTPYVCFLTIA